MQKQVLLSVALLLSLPGCWKKKVSPVKYAGSKTESVKDTKTSQTYTEEEMPADETVNNFFDEESSNELVPVEEPSDEISDLATEHDEYSEIGKNEDNFKTIYFDFDSHDLRKDQANCVAEDIARAQQVLDEARAQGKNPKIIIEGHACHSAGSGAYNIAKSEKRAKAVKEWFISAGIPETDIKIVGRGSEVPAVVAGKQISGNRQEQWPNRRVEVHVLFS